MTTSTYLAVGLYAWLSGPLSWIDLLLALVGVLAARWVFRRIDQWAQS